MVDTYTNSLRLTKPEVGANDDSWGPLLNDGMISLLEAGVAGVTTVDVTAGDVVLTANNGAADQARAMILRVIGTPPFIRLLTIPSVSKLYFVINETDQEVALVGPGTEIVNGGQNSTLFVNIGHIPVINVIDQSDIAASQQTITDPQSPNDSFTFDIPGANGGAGTTAGVEYLVTGEFCYINIDSVNDINWNTTSLNLSISAGTLPAEILPVEPQYIPVSLWEDTGGGWVYTPSVLRIQAAATDWQIVMIDGSNYTLTSDRAWMYNISTLYPLTAHA